MGVNYHGCAVLGCEITRHVPKTRTVPGCGHRHDANFCPTCGKPKTVERKVHLEEWLQEQRLIDKINGGGLNFATTTDDERVFVGLAVVADGEGRNDARRAAGFDVELVRTALLRMLEPIGMWDESSFGLWAVMHVSY